MTTTKLEELQADAAAAWECYWEAKAQWALAATAEEELAATEEEERAERAAWRAEKTVWRARAAN